DFPARGGGRGLGARRVSDTAPLRTCTGRRCNSRVTRQWRRLHTTRLRLASPEGSTGLRAADRRFAQPRRDLPVDAQKPRAGWNRSAPPDTDHRFEQARGLAHGAASGLEQPVFGKDEVARLAARRHDLDVVSGGARRTQRVAQVVLDISSPHAQLARERGDRTKLVRQQIDQLPPVGHPSIFSRGAHRRDLLTGTRPCAKSAAWGTAPGLQVACSVKQACERRCSNSPPGIPVVSHSPVSRRNVSASSRSSPSRASSSASRRLPRRTCPRWLRQRHHHWLYVCCSWSTRSSPLSWWPSSVSRNRPVTR